MRLVEYVCPECGEVCETNLGGAKPFRVSRCHGVAVETRPTSLSGQLLGRGVLVHGLEFEVPA